MISSAWNWDHLNSILPQCEQKGRLQCSSPSHKSHQGFCLGCFHQINHWELLKIHWSPSAFQPPQFNFFSLPFSLCATCFNISFIYYCMHDCRWKQGQIYLKDLFLWTCFLSTLQPTTPLPPLMSWGRRKQYWASELMEKMTDMLFANKLMDSPNNNTIIVSKRITHLISHSRSCRYNYLHDVHRRHFFNPVCVMCVTLEQRAIPSLGSGSFWPNRLQTCYISSLKPSVWCIKNTLSHIIHALEHCYPFTVLMNSFPLADWI